MSFWKRQSNKAELRSYLLGSLPEARQEALEQRLLTDSVFYEELLATEDDLVDEYLTKKLSEHERRQFVARFAVSPQRQSKIRFGHMWRNYLDSLSDSQKVSQLSRTKEDPARASRSAIVAFVRRKPLAAMPVIALVCLGLVALWWVVYRRQSESHSQARTFAITLVPGSDRSMDSGTQRLQRPEADTRVEAQLELATSEYRTYSVQLVRDETTIRTFEMLLPQPKDSHFVVAVEVDPSILEPGDYSFKLSGVSDGGKVEFKDRYYLRVVP